MPLGWRTSTITANENGAASSGFGSMLVRRCFLYHCFTENIPVFQTGGIESRLQLLDSVLASKLALTGGDRNEPEKPGANIHQSQVL